MGLTVLNYNPFRKLHPAAFSGTAICPTCFGSKVKLLDRVGPYVRRYQCKSCHMIYREDLTPVGHYGDQDIKTREVGNPYASFKNLKPTMHIGIHKFKK